ncbi:MAG: GNAT family N-acetyltransferase [Candidatus Eremiobacteraeota bacterium]|nr:GNAT family N-acetyltransferase [Candidatus Eremiobacteraeota bacterium]
MREALAEDAERIAALAHQLGYTVNEAHILSTLQTRSDDYEIFVAVVPRAGVVGWIGVRARQTLTTQRRAEVEGLVVEDEYRGTGIGKRLLERAERWGRNHECESLRLFTNVVRERAHHFYEREGYGLLKTERLYQKNL